MKTTLNFENTSATIDSKGAELISFISNKRNYIWTVDEQFWNRTSPILFPIVGKLKNESYTYNNSKYNLNRHGFARNFEFKVVQKSEAEIVFSLESNDEMKANYPFDFELQIGYILTEKELKIQYKVINKSNDEMPFSIGAHPAFSLPKSFNNYSLEFEKQEVLYNYSLQNELLTDDFEVIHLENKTLPLNYNLFEKDALIFKKIQSKKITILENSKPFLKVNFEDFPNLGIWTKIGAPFICIEPWFGYADHQNFDKDIFLKEGILILQKSEDFKCEYSIEVL